ncbi:MAG: arylsulfatase [Nitrososphaeria archaeon]|nr:arylsulfatase [Nitrososphaeria archaeon]
MLKIIFSLLIIIILLSMPATTLAQIDNTLTFRAKGIVTGEHFNGGRLWTSIQGDKATTITQWSLGRSLIHSNVISSTECEPSFAICFEATITDAKNTAAVKTGDKFLIGIDPENKKQTIIGKVGFLENTTVVLTLDKIYTKTVHKTSVVDNRPNILVAVLDDTGFADLAFTGSEIPTPTLDALRNEGKLFTNFHTLPTCSPTRSVLLSGVDNHLNGLGTMVEGLTENQKGKPGYEGYLNYDIVTIPQLLQDSGYHTYMTGKWHLSYGMTDPAKNWEEQVKYDPHSRGFEETLSVEIPGSHFTNLGLAPTHLPIATRNGEQVDYPQGYIDDVFTDTMIQFIDKNRQDQKPMFMYLAFWNNHWPIQAPTEYIKKYEGKYDAGWDKIREQRFEKQKELGLMPNNMILSPRNNAVPAWDSLNATEQKQQAKKMEIYAAMLDSLDHNLGRVVDHLKETGEYDNTIIFVFADNGAEASDPTKAAGHGADPQEYHHWVDSHFNNTFANWGNGDSILGIGPGWAQVGNTPLFREKGLETEGGTRVPMLIKMTGKSQESSSSAFTRVADVSATILDYANVVHPGTTYKGQKVHSMEGKTIRPIIDGTVAQIYDEDEAVSAELFGNSAVYKGDYKALLLVPPLGDGKWKLFDLSHDIGEQNDLSSKYPDKLDEMVKDYNDYSKRVGVVPPLGLDLSVFSAGDTQ